MKERYKSFRWLIVLNCVCAIVFSSYDSLAFVSSDRAYVVLDGSKSFSSQVNKQNTTYEIRDSYDLNGQSVTIPRGSLLLFNGGSIQNGSLIFNNCIVSAVPYQIFHQDLSVSGFFSSEHYHPEWFGAKGDSVSDDSSSIQKLIDCGLPVHLGPKTYCIKNPLNVRNSTTIQGSGFSTIIKAIGCDAISSKQSSTGVLISNLRLLGDKTSNCSGIHFEYSMWRIRCKLTPSFRS